MHGRGRISIGTALVLALVALTGAIGSGSELLDQINMVSPLLLAAVVLFAGLAAIRLTGRARWLALVPVVVASAASLPRILPEWQVRAMPPRAALRPELTLLSWNVFAKNDRPGEAIDALRASGADVLLLQETTGAVGAMTGALSDLYPHIVTCETLCEFTVLSKRPLEKERMRPWPLGGGTTWPPLRRVWLRLDDGTRVPLVSIHIPHVDQRVLGAMVAGHLRPGDRRFMVVAGDLNSAPWTRTMAMQDRLLQPMVRYSRALPTWPVSLFGATWPAPFLPIDHLYAGPGWKRVELTAQTLPGSDHRAIRATLYR